jgi:nitroreductase/NAD-dependent dihydropyrimidine dehydrogenase PreA subunit
MHTIAIDPAACKKDGICIDECPTRILEEGPDRVPRVRKGALAACLGCGHCLAVCPGGAVTLDSIGPEACEPLNKADAPAPEQVRRLFRSRRSIRTYKPDPLAKNDVAELLDLARWAPSAKNGEPVRWAAVLDPDTVRELASMVIEWMRGKDDFEPLVRAFDAGRDLIHRGAPCLLVAHADKRGIKPAEDCAIAVTTVEAAAPAYGLGACWAGYFMTVANLHRPILERLGLPREHRVYGALMLGRPKYRYLRVPPRAEAKVRWL